MPLQYETFTTGAGTTWTDMPAAVTFLAGLTRNRWVTDLSNMTEARMTVTVQTAGASGAKLMLRYRTSDDGTATNWTLNVGARDIEQLIDTTGPKDTGWIPITALARTQATFLTIVGSTGDGAADPVFDGPRVYFR